MAFNEAFYPVEMRLNSHNHRLAGGQSENERQVVRIMASSPHFGMACLT